MVMSIFKPFKSLFMSQENIPNPTADAAQVPTVVSLDLQPNMVNEPLEVSPTSTESDSTLQPEQTENLGWQNLNSFPISEEAAPEVKDLVNRMMTTHCVRLFDLTDGTFEVFAVASSCLPISATFNSIRDFNEKGIASNHKYCKGTWDECLSTIKSW